MTGHRQPAMTASRLQRFCRTFSTLLTAEAKRKTDCRFPKVLQQDRLLRIHPKEARASRNCRPFPSIRGMRSRAGGIRTHVGSVGNHTHPASRIAVGATRRYAAGKKATPAFLSQSYVLSRQTSASAAQGLSFGRPKHNFGPINQITREAPAKAGRARAAHVVGGGAGPRRIESYSRAARRAALAPLVGGRRRRSRGGARPLAEGLFRRCDARATPLGRIPNCAICAFPPSALPSVNRESLLVPN